MQELQDRSAQRKPPRVVPEGGAEEQREDRRADAVRAAFVAGARGRRLDSTDPQIRAAWLRGRAFAAQQAAGLRPLDTVRRKP